MKPDHLSPLDILITSSLLFDWSLKLEENKITNSGKVDLDQALGNHLDRKGSLQV
jgi:hypothetical protein